jgi:hypothetical protein
VTYTSAWVGFAMLGITAASLYALVEIGFLARWLWRRWRR